MRLHNRVWLLGGLVACLAQGIVAQCPHGPAAGGDAASSVAPASTSPPAPEATTDQRIVILSLVISQSGAVRDATPLSGPPTLRKPAIEAAKRRKYKSKSITGATPPHQMMVAVKFAPGKDTAPEIEEAIIGGLPGCVFPTAIRVSQAVMQTHLLSRGDPAYPPEALAQRVDGVVVLRVRIDKNANVFKAEKVSGADALVPAAIDAVKQWKYQPYLLNGEPFEVETTVEISFGS